MMTTVAYAGAEREKSRSQPEILAKDGASLKARTPCCLCVMAASDGYQCVAPRYNRRAESLPVPQRGAFWIEKCRPAQEVSFRMHACLQCGLTSARCCVSLESCAPCGGSTRSLVLRCVSCPSAPLSVPPRCVARDAAYGLAQEYTALRRQQQFLEEQTKLVCTRSHESHLQPPLRVLPDGCVRAKGPSSTRGAAEVGGGVNAEWRACSDEYSRECARGSCQRPRGD